jgi:PAS domain S-box-containing protein
MNSNFVRPVVIDEPLAWDKSTTITSKTDAFGTIDYVNEGFVEVSGYQDNELVGQPHNIIRHPDMPKIIFKILWDNLKKGSNFKAIVKNLSKSGKYYWVFATFRVVLKENGTIDYVYSTRKSVDDLVINTYISPLYATLLEAEKKEGIEASEQVLNDFLNAKNQTYLEFIENILS